MDGYRYAEVVQVPKDQQFTVDGARVDPGLDVFGPFVNDFLQPASRLPGRGAKRIASHVGQRANHIVERR